MYSVVNDYYKPGVVFTKNASKQFDKLLISHIIFGDTEIAVKAMITYKNNS